MAHVKTYFLAPNFDHQPGGKIKLGNIIADPFVPHRALNTPSTPPADEQIEETIQYDYRNEHSKGDGVDMSIWAQLLYNIGLRLGTGYSKNTTVEYSMTSLKTIQYSTEPTTEEIAVRIQDAKIQNIMQPNRYRSCPVFMITAIKIAEKLSVSVGNDTQKNASLEGSVPLSENVGAGANISMDRHKEQKESFHMEKDVVFAYQLLEIGFKGWREKALHVDEYKSQAAFLSNNTKGVEKGRIDDGLEIRSGRRLLDTQMELLREFKLRDMEQDYLFVDSEE
jgi:hypothetical protein